MANSSFELFSSFPETFRRLEVLIVRKSFERFELSTQLRSSGLILIQGEAVDEKGTLFKRISIRKFPKPIQMHMDDGVQLKFNAGFLMCVTPHRGAYTVAHLVGSL